MTSCATVDPFAAFFALTELRQLALIERMNADELTKLHHAYMRFAKTDPSLDSREVWSRLLERMNPGEFLENDQPAKVRSATSEVALRAVRVQTYEYQIRPLLSASLRRQQKTVDDLTHEERCALLKTLDRYAREYGRSERCRAFEQMVRDAIG